MEVPAAAVELTPTVLDSALAASDRELRTIVTTATADWRARADAAVDAFWGTRLARERAMRATEPPSRLFQAGLFDRRAERMRWDARAARDAADADREARIAAIQQMLDSIRCSISALLILVPPQC
jgi:hypothetical protein